MGKDLSILANFTGSCLRREPVPYLVIDRCLPEAIYTELDRGYSQVEEVIREVKGHRLAANARYDLHPLQALQNKRMPSIWKDFIAYHCSTEFWQEYWEKLGDVVVKAHPDIAARIGVPPASATAGFRGRFRSTNVVQHCNVGINTPAVETNAVRGPHLDESLEISVGLLYFRHPDDTTAGGDLGIYRWRNGVRFAKGYEIDMADTELLETVPYAANRLAMLINSLDTIHGVSPRAPGQYSRRLVTVVSEVKSPLFNHPELPAIDPKRYASGLGSYEFAFHAERMTRPLRRLLRR